MTDEEPSSVCNLCNEVGSVTLEPQRRTLVRGSDPDDPSLSAIGVLPDALLCVDHAEKVRWGELTLGWCDHESCRCFGEVGVVSLCGDPFTSLKR